MRSSCCKQGWSRWGQSAKGPDGARNQDRPRFGRTCFDAAVDGSAPPSVIPFVEADDDDVMAGCVFVPVRLGDGGSVLLPYRECKKESTRRRVLLSIDRLMGIGTHPKTGTRPGCPRCRLWDGNGWMTGCVWVGFRDRKGEARVCSAIAASAQSPRPVFSSSTINQ